MEYQIASDLGEADFHPDFRHHQKCIIAANKEMLPRFDRAGQRAQHPKSHATVDATFTVLELDERDRALQIGLFAEPGRARKAGIRFSNSQHLTDNPKGGDAHGMAIKVFDVDGVKFEPDPDLERAENTEERIGTFDFVLMNDETFFEGRLEDYTTLNEVSAKTIAYNRNGGNWVSGQIARLRTFGYLLRNPDLMRAIRHTSDQFPVSLLHETYFSTTPYLLGDDHAVKYVVRPDLEDPVTTGEAQPQKDANYLTKRLRRSLAERAHHFTMFVRIKRPADSDYSIENPRNPWRGAREVAVAKITIAQLEHPVTEAVWQHLRFGQDKRRYNIWNVTHHHRPLGLLNRLRREVYKELHRTRVDLDGDAYQSK